MTNEGTSSQSRYQWTREYVVVGFFGVVAGGSDAGRENLEIGERLSPVFEASLTSSSISESFVARREVSGLTRERPGVVTMLLVSIAGTVS